MRNLIIIILLSTSIGCVAQIDTTNTVSNTLSTKMIGNILTKDTLSGTAAGKRIRDAALYTFIYHYTFAAKSKSIII